MARKQGRKKRSRRKSSTTKGSRGSGGGFPWRVTAIAALITVAVVALFWLALGGGGERPAGDTPATGPTTGTEPPAGGPPGVPDPSTADLESGAQERVSDGVMSLRLFLVAPGMERLVAVQRDVDAPRTLAAQAHRAVQELADWAAADTVSPLPPGTEVREVWVSPAGIAYVDFDGSLRTSLPAGSLGEIHAVYGVVATLTRSFPEIRAVQILLDAEEIDTLAGHVDVSRPLVPLADWVIERPLD